MRGGSPSAMWRRRCGVRLIGRYIDPTKQPERSVVDDVIRIRPGSTVAIVGSGPIGLATLLTAQFYFLQELRNPFGSIANAVGN
jgi:hypothetical protein